MEAIKMNIVIVAACTMLVSSWVYGLELKLIQHSCPSNCTCDIKEYSIKCVLNDQSSIKDLNGYFNTHPITSFAIHKSASVSALLKLPVERVQKLNISDNMIQVLPSNIFSRFKKIRVLDISYNYIDTIEESAFESISDHIIALNMGFNKLGTIPSYAFQSMNNLRFLDLNNNRLEFIPPDTFNQLINLETLDLSFNRLSFLSSTHFANLVNLTTLILHNNIFRTFHQDVLPRLSNIQSVDMSFNPYECSCAISSLIDAVKNTTSFIHLDDTTCNSPTNLKGRLLLDVDVEYLNCSHPSIAYLSPDTSIINQGDLYLSCQVVGYPNPSIVWMTPWGESFSHQTYHHLIGDDATDYNIRNSYIGEKQFFSSRVHVLENGTLHINKFRGYFAGNFTCLALTPIGNVSATVKVDIFSTFRIVYITSLIIGGMTAGAFAVVGIIIGIILTLVRRVCCRSRFMEEEKIEKVPEIVIITTGSNEDVSCNTEKDDLDEGDDDDDDDSSPDTPLASSFVSSTLTDSPKKYHSPLSESPPQGWLASNMIETLDEVRSKLRYGVERKMETVRSHAKAIKDSSEKKIENVRKNVKTMKDTSEKKIETIRTNVKSFKDSGTVYMQSIKDTSSHAANKVRAGVVLSVETVKYTVQSMKEMCGTGEMGGQTISMMSVETDIDSNQSKEIVRSVTFV
ncbi:hypothetical protein SNE40_013792 [Patella caerulea]|uniref:Ig-like domain-containing protein n=1 Tax=Patella caerulea TaxID=87958 RepID=A0AAN8PHS2_PATCE